MVYAEDSARIRECLGVRTQQIFSSFLKFGAHVEEDELAAEMLGELRRPGNCALGGFGPVGSNDDLHLSKVYFNRRRPGGSAGGAGASAPQLAEDYASARVHCRTGLSHGV